MIGILWMSCSVGSLARMSSLTTSVSEILRGIAARQGVTTVELARRTGNRRERINRFFSGKTPIGIEDADMICQALGIELAAVIAEAAKETPDRPSKLPSPDELLRRI
jgi:transcriptional regulator with XRE-family HTH domain